ncbi:hypothetical protein F5144DRAFT_567676 [Chaetomium tenue]|uniref:Uncharacterized protein n=1 Tax=Chaetomium tenue TaxID=1854479 RepID=A0ACB7PCD0_9PEZI|nr:hypothetical protein F5144DRAFT_567676 [Chaetomium globosum]
MSRRLLMPIPWLLDTIVIIRSISPQEASIATSILGTYLPNQTNPTSSPRQTVLTSSVSGGPSCGHPRDDRLMRRKYVVHCL